VTLPTCGMNVAGKTLSTMINDAKDKVHDIFCFYAEWPVNTFICICKRIEKIRMHERRMADKEWNDVSVFTEELSYNQGYEAGYLKGVENRDE